MKAKSKAKKPILIGLAIVLGLLILIYLYNELNRTFQVVWNDQLPQEKIIEIRPIQWGIPTPEMRKAETSGKIYLGGDFCFWCSKYAILIKRN